MKRLNAILLGLTLLLAAVLAVIWGLANLGADTPPQPALPRVAPVAPQPPPAPQVVAASAPPLVAAASPVPVPPEMVKIASAARDTPLDRPMNRVSKSWLGCQSRQGYADTLAMLGRKDPAVAQQFKGDHPVCVMLTVGEKVTVALVDQPDHAVQVRLDAGGDLLWTDPSALDGGE